LRSDMHVDRVLRRIKCCFVDFPKRADGEKLRRVGVQSLADAILSVRWQEYLRFDPDLFAGARRRDRNAVLTIFVPLHLPSHSEWSGAGGANAGRTHLSKVPIVQQPIGLWPMSATADILYNKLFDLNIDLVPRIDRGIEAGIFLWRRTFSRRTSVYSGLLPKNRPPGIVENPTRSMRLRTKLTPFFVRLERTSSRADCLASEMPIDRRLRRVKGC
jgi:hypothetical protein